VFYTITQGNGFRACRKEIEMEESLDQARWRYSLESAIERHSESAAKYRRRGKYKKAKGEEREVRLAKDALLYLRTYGCLQPVRRGFRR